MPIRLPRKLHLAAAFAVMTTSSLTLADDRSPGSRPSGPPPSGAGAPASAPSAAPGPGRDSAGVIKALNDAWPDRPEWLDMYTAILQDEPMGPNYGWFRTAVTQTRFGWDSTRDRYDSNRDGRIARKEFPGDDADFARLDRDRDGALTPADFDFSGSNMPNPGLMLFSRADADGNGKVTREELESLFRRADRDGAGFLSRSDLETLLPMPSRGMSPGDGPSKETLIRGLFRQEVGSLQPGPKLDEPAPDFSLKTNDGNSDVSLSSQIGPKPVVLIFGNFTCGPFRSQAGNFEKLYRRYKDRATFLMVYVREAHPTDGWRMESNDRVGVSTAQPTTNAARAEVAQRCGKLLGLGFPMLVDTVDDAVGGRYSGMPGRFYLIDRNGKVAFKNGRGPYGFKPDELEHSLVLLLQGDSSETKPGAKPPVAVSRGER